MMLCENYIMPEMGAHAPPACRFRLSDSYARRVLQVPQKFSDPKSPASQYQIGESEQSKQLCGVLGQAAIARPTMTEQVLDDK